MLCYLFQLTFSTKLHIPVIKNTCLCYGIPFLPIFKFLLWLLKKIIVLKKRQLFCSTCFKQGNNVESNAIKHFCILSVPYNLPPKSWIKIVFRWTVKCTFWQTIPLVYKFHLILSVLIRRISSYQQQDLYLFLKDNTKIIDELNKI